MAALERRVTLLRQPSWASIQSDSMKALQSATGVSPRCVTNNPKISSRLGERLRAVQACSFGVSEVEQDHVAHGGERA